LNAFQPASPTFSKRQRFSHPAAAFLYIYVKLTLRHDHNKLCHCSIFIIYTYRLALAVWGKWNQFVIAR
jgi:hypothetical protein